MASGFSLKDDLFNADTIGDLVAEFRATGAIDADRFERQVMSRLGQLELKERITWIADCLVDELPDRLEEAAPILRAALPPPLDPGRTDDDFGRFIHAPLGEVVSKLGLETAPDLSLDLFEEITQRFSMELSIRAFLIRWPDLVLERMEAWTQHENYHVRRLVSEGTRPKLPWAPAIGLDVARPLDLLDALHADPTRYVTRSVANHLNDIAKVDRGLVIDRLAGWRDAGRQRAEELGWMTGHAVRGLIKAGDPQAMALMGFDPDAPITVRAFDVPDSARFGDAVEISAVLESDAPVGAIVDYVFWRRRANGALAPKVHKMKTVQLKPGVPVTIAKRHRLKADATTYKLYAGAQKFSLQVNGRVLADAPMDLKEA